MDQELKMAFSRYKVFRSDLPVPASEGTPKDLVDSPRQHKKLAVLPGGTFRYQTPNPLFQLIEPTQPAPN